MTRPAPHPLRGTTVVDVSRMLPGAVTARLLADLGARVIKVEAPGFGDPLRLVPPLVDGIGAAFGAFYGGAESICLDLKQPEQAATLGRIAGRADVLLESFRPGTLEAWGVGPEQLLAEHPALVVCSLSSFGVDGPAAQHVAHDLNLVASSGLLGLLSSTAAPGEQGRAIPRVQIADVATGLLAGSAILAALLGRRGSGRGGWIDQPLASGPRPFLTLALAERSAGGAGLAETVLAGGCAAYRLYACGDGRQLAVAALEPKFWSRFVELLGLPELTATGLDPGPAGQAAAHAVGHALAAHPRPYWLRRFGGQGLPITAVLDLSEAPQAPAGAGYLPSLGPRNAGAVPRLGEQTAAIVAEFGR